MQKPAKLSEWFINPCGKICRPVFTIKRRRKGFAILIGINPDYSLSWFILLPADH